MQVDYEYEILSNGELLHSEIEVGLPGMISGVSRNGNKTIVNVIKELNVLDRNALDMIVFAHDPTKLTYGQQKSADRQDDKEAGRAFFDVAVDPQAVTLADLAERVAWLEQEIRDLIGE